MSSNSLLIIGSPYSHANKRAFTQKFIRLLATVSEEIVYVGANAPDQTPENVNIEPVKFEPSSSTFVSLNRFVMYQTKAAKLVEIGQYDSIIIRPQTFLLLATYLRLRRKRFAVFAAQAQESNIMQKFSRATFRIADSLIIESTGTYDWHPLGIAHKCFDGRSYVNLTRFRPTESKSSGRFTVGYLGLLSERKGVLQLLEAIELLNSNNDLEFEFQFGGSGDYEQAVSEVARSQENVSFHGFVPDDDLADFYRDLDVLILPSESEGLPNVVIEAMACGTPALTTRVGGIPQLVEDGANGFILPNREPETIASELSEIHQKSEIESISRAASSTVHSEYSREKAVERYRNIVQSLCGT